MGWPVDMEQNECGASIHDHDIDFCLTIVGWVDVPDNISLSVDKLGLSIDKLS